MARERPARPKPPEPAKKSAGALPRGYQELMREIKERIRSAQLRASVSVNPEMIVLYWQIGRLSCTCSPNHRDIQPASSSDVPRLSDRPCPTVEKSAKLYRVDRSTAIAAP